MSATNEAEDLAGLVEVLLARIDDEMEHGKYGAPDIVPPEYAQDAAVDYYEEHERIVDEVCRARKAVQDKIAEIRKGGIP